MSKFFIISICYYSCFTMSKHNTTSICHRQRPPSLHKAQGKFGHFCDWGHRTQTRHTQNTHKTHTRHTQDTYETHTGHRHCIFNSLMKIVHLHPLAMYQTKFVHGKLKTQHQSLPPIIIIMMGALKTDATCILCILYSPILYSTTLMFCHCIVFQLGWLS